MILGGVIKEDMVQEIYVETKVLLNFDYKIEELGIKKRYGPRNMLKLKCYLILLYN